MLLIAVIRIVAILLIIVGGIGFLTVPIRIITSVVFVDRDSRDSMSGMRIMWSTIAPAFTAVSAGLMLAAGIVGLVSTTQKSKKRLQNARAYLILVILLVIFLLVEAIVSPIVGRVLSLGYLPSLDPLDWPIVTLNIAISIICIACCCSGCIACASANYKDAKKREQPRIPVRAA